MMQGLKKSLLALLLTILAVGMFPLTVYAADSPDVVIGNNYTLNSGEILHNNLFILGGNVDLMVNSIIYGNVILLGGNLSAAGTINGDVVILGGTANLASTFSLNGNLSTAGTTVNRDPGAVIKGNIYTGTNAPQIFTIPGTIRLTNFTGNANPLWGVASFILRLLVWVLVAMVIAMFIPSLLSRVTETILSEPVTSGGMGLLTIIVAPIAIVLIAITICLIPIAILAAFVLAAAWCFGLIAIGFEVGKRINRLTNQEWHPVVRAGLGTLLLMAVLSGLEAIIPCVGWIPKVIFGLFGLGAVLLTQFGTKPYPRETIHPPQSPVEVLPPQGQAL
jgi:hypothetical protein